MKEKGNQKSKSERNHNKDYVYSTVFKAVVLVCASINYFVVLGITIAATTYLPVWLEVFKESRATTAIAQSLLMACMNGFGTFVGYLIERYGLRTVLCSGTLLSAIGFISASYSPNMAVLIVTFGILSGIGSSCLFITSLVAVSKTFGSSARLFMCIQNSFGSSGVSAFSYFIPFLIDTYGWRGSLLLIGAITFQLQVCNMLMTYRVSTSNSNHETNSEKTEKNDDTNLCQKLKTIFNLRYILGCVTSIIGLVSVNGFVIIVSDYATGDEDDVALYLLIYSVALIVCNTFFGLINKVPVLKSTFLLPFASCMTGVALILLAQISSFVFRAILFAMLGVGASGLIVMSSVYIFDVVPAERFPIAVGIFNTFVGIVIFFAGIIYGSLFDLTASYSTPLITMGALSCGSTVLPIIAYLISNRSTKFVLNMEITPK